MSLRGWQVIKPCNNFQNLAFVIFKPFKFSRRHVLTKFSGFHILKPVLFLFDCLSYYDYEHSTEEKTTSVIARKDLKHNVYLKLESAPKKQACQSLWWIYLMGKYLIQTWILTHRTFIFFQLWFSAATTVASSAEWCFCRNQSPGWWCMSLLRWKQFLPNRFSNNMPLYFSYWNITQDYYYYLFVNSTKLIFEMKSQNKWQKGCSHFWESWNSSQKQSLEACEWY